MKGHRGLRQSSLSIVDPPNRPRSHCLSDKAQHRSLNPGRPATLVHIVAVDLEDSFKCPRALAHCNAD